MITQTVNTLEEVVPYTANYFENIALRNNALVTTVFPQINIVTGQINAELAVFNSYSITISTAAANALASANNAAISAAIATAKANLATAVVIPTTATYSYTQQDWRQSMMSKAEFNAIAALNRNIYAGSGHIEMGKNNTTTAFNVNEGITAVPSFSNYFAFGPASTLPTGTSKTIYPIATINGIYSNISYIGTNDIAFPNKITLPTAPTVLPSTATLTQQQIDSGVIKHADASNSGLIVNGKFDTDTSGWTLTASVATYDAVNSKIAVNNQTAITYQAFQQSSVYKLGKKNIVEFTVSDYVSGSIKVNFFNGTAYVYGPTVTANGVYSCELDVTTASQTSIRFEVVNNTVLKVDNIAVFPVDAISRSDLVFLESWHEDVSEKDFVYPLGNTQYLGTTGDSGTPVAGAFAGATTYSLFSDTWQADSALVGKGYVWSTLSDANKKAFVANPENNCYLDGDKVIQVRYRMRVVAGLGDSWFNNGSVSPPSPFSYNSNSYIVPKGKLSGVTNDISGATYGIFTGSLHGWVSPISLITGDAGIVQAASGAGVIFSGAYEGKCFALPIALVHRRNQGMMHPVYNPNGTKLASDSLPWHSTTVSFTSIADCFTDSKLLATSGYIGTVSGRADGIFYDQAHESDITDLRMNSRGINDFARTIDTYMGKLQSATYRGAEGEWGIVDTYTGVTTNDAYYVGTSWYNGTYIEVSTTGFFAKYSVSSDNIIVNSYKIIAIINGVPFRVSRIESDTRFYIQQILGQKTDYTPSITNGDSVVILVARQSTRTKSNTLTHTDIIGSPTNYKTEWKQSGVSGVPLIVAEDGTSLLPTGTTGSDGLAVFKLSRPTKAAPLKVVKSTDSGVTWAPLAVTTHYTFANNSITFTAGNIPLTTDLIRVTYQAHTIMATATVNGEVVASGRAMAMNGSAVAHLGYSLIGKVMTASTSPYLQDGYGAWGYRIDPTTMKFSTTSTETPTHTAFTLGGGTLGVPTVKTGMYITRSNGKAYLNLVFKEMKYGSYAAPTVVTAASATYTQNMTYKIDIAGCALNGKVIQWIAATATSAIDWSLYDQSPTGVIYLLSSGAVYASARLYDGDSWGDDSKFNIVDNVSTTTDTNGATVLIGQKRVELPYFIGAGE